MSELTPNTNNVRSAYVYAEADVSLRASEEEMEREFDRWLNSVKAEAWDEGREAGHEDYVGSDGTYPGTPNPYNGVTNE